MKIESDDARLLDDLFYFLGQKKIEVEKVERMDEDTSERPMTGGFEGFLSMGADATAIITGLVLTIRYIHQNYPEWLVIFKSDQIEMSADEFMAMSDNAREAVTKTYKVLIRKK